MQKIISLFQRNYETDHLVRNEIVPGAEWVTAGQGIATRKWDGMCCRIIDCILQKRYDVKNGKTPPAGFIPAQDPDPVTGHWPGWLPVSDTDPADWCFGEGFADAKAGPCEIEDGTYELIGPKINKNTDKAPGHILVRHGQKEIKDAPRTFEALKVWFADKDIEGIVWHHPDGRMVKIKKKDFGHKR